MSKANLTETELEQMLHGSSFANAAHKEALRKRLFGKGAAFMERSLTPLSDEELELAAGGKADTPQNSLRPDADPPEEEWKKRMGLYW